MSRLRWRRSSAITPTAQRPALNAEVSVNRDYARPSPVSNLRHLRRQRTLVFMLALAGTVACGREDPTGLRAPDLASPAKQLTVPARVSFLTQVYVDATKAEVENSRIGVNDLDNQTYAGTGTIPSRYTSYNPPGLIDGATAPPPPDTTTSACTAFYGCAAYSRQMSGYRAPAPRARAPSRGSKSTRPSFLLSSDCPLAVNCYSTTDPCSDYRNQLIVLNGDYTRAYVEFWQNLTVEPWRFALNWAVGGPRDIMRDKFRQMYFVALAYKSYGCPGRPPRGGWGAPG